MKQAILDTDILSEFLRGNKNVYARVEAYVLEYGFVSLSIITYYEILNGLLYKDARKQMGKFEQFAELNKIVPLTVKSVRLSANIQAELRKKGTQIGHTDTLIAGIAIASRLQLITNNIDHFKRINRLDIANWSK